MLAKTSRKRRLSVTKTFTPLDERALRALSNGVLTFVIIQPSLTLGFINKISMQETNQEIIKQIFQPRDPQAYKYNFGYLIVIGGSQLYTGAPALTALGAYKSGVDKVTVIAPQRAANIIASFSPSLITSSLKGERLNDSHLSCLLMMVRAGKEAAHGKCAVAIGGGLGRSEETFKAVIKFLSQIDVPCVIDADAIHAIAKQKSMLNKSFVLTPHNYEFYILTGKLIKEVKELEEKIEIVKEAAKNLNTNILLKGNPDILSDGEEVILNKTGNPFMTVAGTGDVLTGICGALLARGIDPFLAAQASAYISGKAGDLAAENLGESLMAEDVINHVSQVIKL